MHRGLVGLILGGLLFATLPSSTNYGLNNYGFGSGGNSSSSSANYSLNGISGEVSNTQSGSTNYNARSGNNNEQQVPVPPAPSFTNAANYYNKLKFVINPGTNASDAKFAIAISSDGFVTTQYVQVDDTVGSSLTISNFQTYTAWGGASGQFVVGLAPSTSYQIKVSAIQGAFDQTEFGPTASAATVAPSISFSMFTDSQPTAPFSTGFGSLLPATVTTASDKIWINLATNAESGASVYLNSANGSLHSTARGTDITSATADLSATSTGYGAQVVATSQTSGGPLTSLSPYNVASNNVGILSTLLTPIFTTSTPITGGSGDFKLLAKASSQTTESSDYQDTLTLTAAAAF